MDFKDVNGWTHQFQLRMSEFRLKDEENSKSHGQYEVGRILAKIYGAQNIVEDYPLPGCGNLSFDFWIPHKKIAFEIDGIQHKQFVKFFHKTKNGFIKQKIADASKQKLADINDITLYTIDKNISEKDLIQLLIGEVNES